MNERTRSLLRRATSLWAVAAVLLASVSAVAQTQDDLPGRVGRVADFAGELFLAPQDKPDAWAPVGLNYPITHGDNLWVGHEGRAEIDFGGGQFRLAGDSNLHVSRLDDRQFALFVAQGRVSLRVRVLDAGETAQVDTPNAQIAITRPGLYRIDVSEDREHSLLVVREGEANVLTQGGVQQVLPGQSATIDGTDPRYANVTNGVGSDGFDTWVASRDRRYMKSRSANYVSPQMVGAADLDQYGSWSQVPEYGAMWYPSDVPADWAPYRNGYWADVGVWGPTWVDAAPWGYAPFHYGRWAYVGGRWGWAPGRYIARPLWAPALVAWTGGAGWGVGVSVGGPVYGWVPLGWGEAYRPWWGRCSYGCWDRYNRPYNVNVAVVRPNSPAPTRYVNFNAPNGVTAVSATAFAARQPVQQNLVRVSRDVVATAPMMTSPPPMRTDTSRVMGRRPDTAPPPASTFQPTMARPSSTPGGSSMMGGRTTGTDRSFSRTTPPPQPTTAPSAMGRSLPAAPPAQPSLQPTPSRGAPSTTASTAPMMRQPQPATPPPVRTDDGRSFNRAPPPVSNAPVQSSRAMPSPSTQPALQPQYDSGRASRSQGMSMPTPVQQPQGQPPARVSSQQPVPQAMPQRSAPPPPVPQAMPQRSAAPQPVQQAAPQPMPQPRAAPPPPPPAQPQQSQRSQGQGSPEPTPPPSGSGNTERRSR